MVFRPYKGHRKTKTHTEDIFGGSACVILQVSHNNESVNLLT